MDISIIREILGWCALINYSILIAWFVAFILVGDWVYGITNKWFSLSRERFDAIHFITMAWFETSIWLFFLTPYIALHIIS